MPSCKLLSNKGLSQLRHKGLKLRFQGKGNEAKDLRKLMNFYQIWAHALYPRVQFRDFVRKAEKTCREKRCRVHLAQWQNEVRHGTTDATLAEHGLSGMTLEDEENVARSGSRPVSIDRDEAIQHSKEPQLSPQPPARLHHSTSSSPPRQNHNAVASTSSSRLTTATAPTSTSTDGPAPLSPLERIQFNRAKALAKLAERRRQPEEEEKAKASQQATTVSQQTTIANGGSAAASSSRVMGPFEFDEEPMDEMDPAEEYFDEF
ncbi:hypothetical protein BC938DRAFT_471839 [Jimgerdemannia flammicorona]|uniref:Chromosome segregation in meiosis protein n=1 Tax=Jimgerdemannia flammicorona TaxID=994334 RepID=A0A433Q7A1_9FUNG|nr:hypothetical protein BC938DRAFT_471839 [Jimgerdemannia flammicorona]